MHFESTRILMYICINIAVLKVMGYSLLINIHNKVLV